MKREKGKTGRGRDDHEKPHSELDPRADGGLQQDVHVEARTAGRGVERHGPDDESTGAEPPITEQPPGRGMAARSSPPKDQERKRYRSRGPEQDEDEHVPG